MICKNVTLYVFSVIMVKTYIWSDVFISKPENLNNAVAYSISDPDFRINVSENEDTFFFDRETCSFNIWLKEPNDEKIFKKFEEFGITPIAKEE